MQTIGVAYLCLSLASLVLSMRNYTACQLLDRFLHATYLVSKLHFTAHFELLHFLLG